MPLSPRAVRRGKSRVSGSRSLRRALVLLTVALTTVASVAPVGADPGDEKPPLVRIELGGRWLGAPAGRLRLEQRSIGAGVSLQPVPWLVLHSAIEASSTEIGAPKLAADPFKVRTRLDARRSWGFAHALTVRTHEFGVVHLDAFGEVRWMPGTSALRILQLILEPGSLDLSELGRLNELARMRFSWWQAAMGARVGVRIGPLDAWVDAGALWVRVGLRYLLRERALALGRLAAPDANIDSGGSFAIHEGQPFARVGLQFDLPGMVRLTGTGMAVPTRRGLAHGVTLGASWTM